jgi:hypothetical protein
VARRTERIHQRRLERGDSEVGRKACKATELPVYDVDSQCIRTTSNGMCLECDGLHVVVAGNRLPHSGRENILHTAATQYKTVTPTHSNSWHTLTIVSTSYISNPSTCKRHHSNFTARLCCWKKRDTKKSPRIPWIDFPQSSPPPSQQNLANPALV